MTSVIFNYLFCCFYQTNTKKIPNTPGFGKMNYASQLSDQIDGLKSSSNINGVSLLPSHEKCHQKTKIKEAFTGSILVLMEMMRRMENEI